MARGSQIFRERLKPLEVTRGHLDRRWIQLSDSIADAMGLPYREVRIEPDYQADGVWAGLVGHACERVERQRGLPSFVAPLLELPNDLTAWLGIQEVWDQSGTQRFAFRHLSLSVHFGFVGDPLKPQVFRSEWAGLRDWTGAGVGFQSPGSGHPHWQFDMSSALRASGDESRHLTFGDEEKVEEFSAVQKERDVFSLVRYATVERMHFASSAPWWNQVAGSKAHMNAPANEDALTRWLFASISYLRQELARCEISPAI